MTMTIRLRLLILGAAAALASPAALAFQETKGGAASTPAPQEEQKAPLDVRGTGTSIDNSSQGLEIRLPGLGKLGVLPKLDFGLELLYGVNGQTADQPPRPGVPGGADEDTKIRGSLKHRF